MINYMGIIKSGIEKNIADKSKSSMVSQIRPPRNPAQSDSKYLNRDAPGEYPP